jgi:hypothetical protein
LQHCAVPYEVVVNLGTQPFNCAHVRLKGLKDVSICTTNDFDVSTSVGFLLFRVTLSLVTATVVCLYPFLAVLAESHLLVSNRGPLSEATELIIIRQLVGPVRRARRTIRFAVGCRILGD